MIVFDDVMSYGVATNFLLFLSLHETGGSAPKLVLLDFLSSTCSTAFHRAANRI